MKKLFVFAAFIAAVLLSACSDDSELGGNDPQPQPEVPVQEPPTVSFENESLIFTTKVSQMIEIKPIYTHNEDATYAWSIENKVISTDPDLQFTSEESGSFYITITVKNEGGEDSAEIRIDVRDLEAPAVSLPGSEKGYMLVEGTQLELKPIVESKSEAHYRWTMNEQEVSTEKDYTFKESVRGEYAMKFAAENEDGADSVEFVIRVCSADEVDFKWTFLQTEYNVALGRTICLKAIDIENGKDAVYTWTKDGEQVQQNANPEYYFTAESEGRHEVIVEMNNGRLTAAKTLVVNVCPAEGQFYRAKSDANNAFSVKVYEFLPAPGQFVNENYVANTMEEACVYAQGRLDQHAYVSLGGFGGSLTVGFDHSIDNTGDYDFAIEGNPFDGSSEPGVVWVMQDENGDGLPNDTWYELKGSEYGKPETITDYAVTYYRPKSPKSNVAWTDNKGNSGEVDYLGDYHRQDYYYPAWVESDTYTLRGTCLKSRSYDKSGNGTYWVNPAFDWGYSDNFSATDLDKKENLFKISNAVTFDGREANLKYIDFVKVQCAINFKCGWIGEVSTEVFAVRDANMNAK